MPLFTVIASYEVQVSHVASVEIEAENEAAATEIAERMNHDGELPWAEESSETVIETNYDVSLTVVGDRS